MPDTVPKKSRITVNMQIHREDHEPPPAIEDWGRRFHHLGVPMQEMVQGERYIPQLKFYVAGFDRNPFGVEWMRFEKGCPMPDIIQKIPHLAFEVDDLDYELERRDFTILVPPNEPSGGVRVAMIEYQGAPVELMEFTQSDT